MPSTFLELLDWRRRVAALYADARRREPGAETLAWFRAEKDRLFSDHPQTPIAPAERAGFGGLSYWDFDPRARVEAHFVPHAGLAVAAVPASAEREGFTRIGWLHFAWQGQPCRLGAFWIHGYAGGLFVPFRDATSGTETYGGGRYALDTIKSADLGSRTDDGVDRVTLDFNYAYHPSCAFDARWACPLAPRENWLSVPIRAGERLAADAHDEGARA